MKSGNWRLVQEKRGLRCGAAALAVTTLAAGACDTQRLDLWPLNTPLATTGAVARDNGLAPTDPASDPLQLSVSDLSPPPRRTQLGVRLSVLHVQIPRERREQVEPLWNHLREEVVDGRAALRLRRNGLRVGVGNGQWWDAVKATIDATAGARSAALNPVRLPPGYPLALELDERPREQTLFFVGDDGILTGETWPQSRNVLRVTYDLELAHPQRVRLTIVPEVRQRLDGWRWVRSAAGVTQEPNYEGRAFGAAAVGTSLEPGEFLLIAPSREAELFGLVGGAFLSQDVGGQRFDSYVFLRADGEYVDRGH